MRTNPSMMRELNRGLLLDIARHQGPLSRADLAKRSSLAKPTVSVIVEDLIGEGLLHETGVGSIGSGGGRRPILLSFNPRSQFAIGVHIGARTTTVMLADGMGDAVARTGAVTPHDDPGAALDGVRDLVKGVIRRSRVAHKRVVGVGVGVPGLVDPATGVCFLSPHLGWRDQPVRAPLERALGLPVLAQNVVQSIAVAEHHEGAAQDAHTVAVFHEDDGIGSALLTGDTLVQGAAGIAGEIGHVRLPGRTEPCHCGGRGCLETLASGPAVARRAAALTGSTLDPSRRVFAELSASADPRIRHLLAQVGVELGIAASWLLTLHNPDVLVLAGGFLEAGEAVVESVRRTALDTALRQAGDAVEIRLSTLGDDAPVRGAVLSALQASDHSYRVASGRGDPHLPFPGDARGVLHRAAPQ